MKRVLIIEDDRDIVELVRYNLANEGFQVSAAGDGSAGLAAVKKSPPDVLLLDLMLPKLSGLEICKEIRRDAALNRLPILMLTARGDEADRVVGLEMGADDYVTKPFSPRELVARVKALLRRAEPPDEAARPIEAGRLEIDPSAYRVTRAGKPVTLSTLEFRLLYYLASRPNRVFTRDQLLLAVDVYATRTLRRDYLRAGYEQLEALGGVARARPPQLDDAAAFRSWVEEMARSGARVTVIAADGRVLADSAEDPQKMENHIGRPEIQQAFASGE